MLKVSSNIFNYLTFRFFSVPPPKKNKYQCKEIEENNRMGKIRDLFKKIRDTKGTFHAKMGSIKGRNHMDLTEAEDIKKRCKNTQKDCTKQIFMTQIITMV